MRQKTKLTITALVVLLFMALAVTVISFSFADDADSESSGTESAEATTLTNIDYIVKNSNDDTLTDTNRKYNIVEIGSGSQSTLGTYASGGGFENYVINGNKTISDMFASGNVSYHYFDAKKVTKTSTTYSNEKDEDGNAITDFAFISQADLIYISNGASPGYKTGNDISEDLFSLIQPRVVGEYIPVIIDMPSKSGSNSSGGTSATTYTMGNALGDYFDTEGKYYYTFRYKSNYKASDFLDTSLSSTSEYLSINAKTQNKNGKYVTVQNGSSTGSMGKVLVVSKSGGAYTTDGTIAKALLGDAVVTDGLNYPATEDGTDAVAVEGTVLDISDSKCTFRGAYNSTYGNIPTYIQLEDISVSELADKSLDDYDMVIIESDVKDETISEDVYKQLGAAMYGKVHITYAESAIVKASTNSSSSSTEASGTNYEKLYNLLAKSDVAAYQNVMITDKSKIDLITSSDSAATAKSIADLINASSYRGIGGPGSTASTFSVLEIEPCYPIDEDIAAANLKKGSYGYYNDGDNMIDGLSLEEIQAQREKAGLSTDLDGSYEYYAWELSKAKIADALDMSVSNITLTQMSTEEFSSCKDEILGKYDLVYIGGNTSAIKDFDKYYSWQKLLNDEKDAYITRVVAKTNFEKLKYLPIYRMYSHNGDIASISSSANVCSTGSGDPLLKTVTTKSGSTLYASSAYTMENGNDISSDNLTYLKAYVAAGMPIIFSSDVTNAYNYIASCNGSDSKYLQNSIDPDSNMCKLLDYCKTVDGSAVTSSTYNNNTNVLWGFHAVNDKTGDTVQTYVEETSSDDGKLSLYTSRVKVLVEEQKSALKSLYVRSSKRPKLVLTESPAIYNFFDSSTIIKSTQITYRIDKTALNTSDYTVKLYIDDDGNSKFSSSEAVSSEYLTVADGSGEIRLTYTLDSSFFGPLYWKVEVTDNLNTSRPKVFVTGLSYVRPTTATKQDVSVLQIMPETRVVGSNSGKGEGSGGLNTLYFCVDCQEAYKNLYFNPSLHSSTFGNFSYYYSGGLTDNYGTITGVSNNVKMGLHEHRFGIVSYDSSMYSSAGGDDWSHNLADDIKDLYNFDIDIMYVSEYERYSRDIAAAYSGMTAEEKETTSQGFSDNYTKLRTAYEEQLKLVEKAEKALDDYLKDAPMMESAKAEIRAKGSYSEYFGLQDTEKCTDGNSRTDEIAKYTALYNTWVEAHDKALILKGGYYVNAYTKQYIDWYLGILYGTNTEKIASEKTSYNQSYEATSSDTDGGIANAKRIMGYKDYQKFANYGDWLNKTYTTVIIGASERFADADITDTTALTALDTYVDAGGQLILFHDTLSAFSDSGAVNLTAHLRSRAGLDKYHLVADTTGTESGATISTVEKTLSNNANVNFSISGKQQRQGNNPQISGTNNMASVVTVSAKFDNGGNWNDFVFEPDASSATYTTSDYGETTYKMTLKNSDGTPLANTEVVLNNQQNYEIQVSGTTDENGYVEITIPNYLEKTVTKTVSSTDLQKYLPFTTTNNTTYPNSVYFMTNLSYKSGSDSYKTFSADFANVYKYNNSSEIKSTFVPGGYTDVIYEGMNGSTNIGVGSYKYAEVNGANTFAAMQDSQFSTKSTTNYGTNRAKKNNNAIVTMYPYQLADEIYISGTHSQAFATDVDDDDLTVLYSFIGGTPSHATTSTYAANPGDGTDNYFMYAYKSVYYCGAGHMKVTGKGADNQNERYLYMNVICNAVRNSAFAPSIDVYDADSTEDNLKNNVVKDDGAGSYEYEIDEDTEYPDFSFKAGVDKDVTLQKVEIYYNLDYVDKEVQDGTNADGSPKMVTVAKTDEFTEGDVLIASWGTAGNKNKSFAADVLGYIKGTDTENLETYIDGTTTLTKLKLKDDYFAPYGGKYTYIVIKVTDSNGQVRYQRIKISYKEKLFNLT